MINHFRLARTWRYFVIASSSALALLFLLAPLLDTTLDAPSSWFLGAIFVGGLTHGILSSRMITSPEGIESVSFGFRVKVSWAKVEKVNINSFGFVNLVVKESIYNNKVLNALLRPLAFDRTIQLSPYMDDVASSTLLQEVAKYSHNSSISEFIVEQKLKPQLRQYQKGGTIGLYYFGWLMAFIPVALILAKTTEELGELGLPNLFLFPYLIGTSLMMGLFLNGLDLLGYFAEISLLSEKQIARIARAYYLNPFVTLLMSFLISLGIWSFLQARSIIVHDVAYGSLAFVAILIGALSPRMSNRIEKIVFKDNSQ